MAGPRYIADNADMIRKVELDGLTAIFHVPSGMTHVVAPPAPQILEAIAGDPASLEEILARVAARFELVGDDNLQAMQARLDELEAAGLVSRA